MDLNHIFPVGRDGEKINHLAERPELPSGRIEVRIALRTVLPRPVLSTLYENFQNNGMDMALDRINRHIIARGIPPDHQYNAQSVLAEVRRFDAGATIFH